MPSIRFYQVAFQMFFRVFFCGLYVTYYLRGTVAVFTA